MQRIHQNYIEGLGLATTAVAAAGVVSGNYGLGVGLVYMIGRYLLLYIECFMEYLIRRKVVHTTKVV